MAAITQTEARSLFKYDATTGKLYWCARDRWRFRSDKALNSWNARWAGREAGTMQNGYLQIGIGGRLHYAHRIIWIYVHGEEPENIDHIDGDCLNNRISNLSAVTHLENMRNRKTSRKNTSGVTGVHWAKASRRWIALISDRGKHIHLGCFSTSAEAASAREAAERELGYHANHGKR